MEELNVLIFERERIVAEDIKRKIRSMVEARVHITHHIHDSLDVLKRDRFDLAILDQVLDGETEGFRSRDVIASFRDIPLIILSCQPHTSGSEPFREHANLEMLYKPIDFSSLRQKMCRLIPSLNNHLCSDMNDRGQQDTAVSAHGEPFRSEPSVHWSVWGERGRGRGNRTGDQTGSGTRSRKGNGHENGSKIRPGNGHRGGSS